MSFHSILYDGPTPEHGRLAREQPAFFVDLNLDQVVASITAGRQEYDLAPFFYARLRSVDAVTYRHDVLRDLENDALRGCISTFAQRLRLMRDQLSQAAKLHYRYQQESWFLYAAQTYCDAVTALVDDLVGLDLSSRGFRNLRRYLEDYTSGGVFPALVAEAEGVTEQLVSRVGSDLPV